MSFIRSSKIKWPLDAAVNRSFRNSHFRVEGCKNYILKREGTGEPLADIGIEKGIITG